MAHMLDFLYNNNNPIIKFKQKLITCRAPICIRYYCNSNLMTPHVVLITKSADDKTAIFIVIFPENGT